MRFAHLADSHLGYRQYNLSEREKDFYEVFNNTVDKIIESDVDFVIHSGDLFDMHKPGPETLLEFQKAFLRLKDANIPVYAIAGNHDSVAKKGSFPPQIIFKELGLRLISLKKPAYVHGGVLICGMPFTQKTQKRVLIERLNELSKLTKNYPKSILVLHQGIDKYLPYDYELEIGNLPLNFDYYAMGHIHNYINEKFGRGRLVYPGSGEISRSNEVNDYIKNGKGFVLVDISPDDMPVVERVKVDMPRQFIKEYIDYPQLNEKLQYIKESIQFLSNKPILEIIVEKGNFNASDVYEVIQDTLGEYALTIRPEFKPDESISIETMINDGESLDPRNLIIDSLDKKYHKKEINNLSIDLLDNLSKGNLEESQDISDNFYNENYEFLGSGKVKQKTSLESVNDDDGSSPLKEDESSNRKSKSKKENENSIPEKSLDNF